MLLNIQPVAALLALSGVAIGSSLKRQDSVETALYAYGTNISGIEVFYGDGTYLPYTHPHTVHRCVNDIIGLAYIGDTTPNWLSATSAINCNVL